MSASSLIAAMTGGAVVALLVASLVARRLMRAGYTWADALVIEAVAVIGGIGAVQSYTALRWLALFGDLDEWLADVAPATVDLFAVAMGLAALRARRNDRRDRYADGLALGYSVAAVLANLAAAGLDVSTHGYTGARVGVVLLAHTAPVVTFLLGSHWLMRRPAVERPGSTTTDAEASVHVDSEAGRAGPAAGQSRDTTETSAGPDIGADTSALGPPVRLPRGAARAQVRRLVARRGEDATVDLVVAKTGVSRRHAARLLREARGLHVVDPKEAAHG